MNYLNPDPEKTWVLDIEADGLNPTKIWCVCVLNLGTDEEKVFYNKEDFNAWLNNSFNFIGHNILSFDIPTLYKLWGSEINLSNCIDTLVLSYLYNPAIDSGHSLDAWGIRLKFPKQEFSDWSQLSEKMVEYCQNDVRLTKNLFIALTEKMLRIGYSELSAEIEHKIRIVIDEQQRNGFYFDRAGALDLLQQLRGIQRNLTTSIQELFPAVSKLVKVGDFSRNKDGSLPAFLKKAWDRYDRVVIDEEEGKYYYYSLEPFNIGSPQQRVSRLLEVGWEPQKFTKKGFPQVDEEALVAFSQRLSEENNPAAKAVGAISEWLVLQGRSSMIETWLGNLGDDSRIHGTVMTCGATTRRMTHSSPNTANIPSAAKAKYGHECRSLWTVPDLEKLVLVGYDASGLETAGLCHYLNNQSATDILLKPKPDDIHTANARRLTEALGWAVDREWGAKTSWYAWLYGAYPPKLGSIVGASKHGMSEQKAGEIVIDTFFRNVPGLKKLIESIQYEWKSSGGRLATIDGGFVICPSVNAALNYKIQSAGAIVMKLTSILLDEEAKKLGIPFKKVGDIHDEGQLEVDKLYSERLGALAVASITRAGELLAFNVPLTGDYKVGLTWAETH